MSLNLTLNNRELSLKDLQGVAAATPFEAELFSFVREWFGDGDRFVFQTSGSTGEPAKISFARAQLEASAMRSVEAFALREGDTALVCLDPRYVAGRMMLVRAIVNKMKIIAVEPSSNPLAGVADNVDLIAVVPLQLKTMLEAGLADRLNRVRTILIGGAPVSPALRRRIIEDLNENVYLTYGMTETLTHVAIERITGEDAAFAALPGVAIELDERGCIVITSDITGKIVTNDLGELLSEGVFRWLGRYDNIINSGGIKLIPEVIEGRIAPVLARLNIHNSFFIAGVPHDRLGSAVALFVEGALAEESRNLLEEALRNALERYEKPAAIHYLPTFVYTENGKINRIQSIRRHGQYRIENS